MRATTTAIIALALLLSTGFRPQAATGPHITILDATPAEVAMVEWALDRFDIAGLELPDLTISFHEDPGHCGEYLGLYSMAIQQVSICNRGGLSTDPRNTVLHELAHAWSFAVLSPEDIIRFNEHRHLEHWTGGDDAWWQQGAEQAAEVLAWGLQDPDDPFRSVWIHTETCEDLDAAFRVLTGSDPLHLAAYCK